MTDGAGHVIEIETYTEAGQEPRTIPAVGGGIRNRIWG
jgi:hypothetical protein